MKKTLTLAGVLALSLAFAGPASAAGKADIVDHVAGKVSAVAKSVSGKLRGLGKRIRDKVRGKLRGLGKRIRDKIRGKLRGLGKRIRDRVRAGLGKLRGLGKRIGNKFPRVLETKGPSKGLPVKTGD